MITPALDLQGAPQLIDRIGPETAPVESGGDFGAAFSASLSATRSASGSPGSNEVAADAGQKLATSGQAGGSGRTAAARANFTSSKSVFPAVGPRAGVATAASIQNRTEGAGVDSSDQAVEAVVSAVVSKSADAVVSGGSGSQSTATASTVLPESQKIALVPSEVLGKGAEDAKDLAAVASQRQDVSSKDTGPTKTAKASQSSAKVDGNQSEAKSKASGQATGTSASHSFLPATSAITNDNLISSLTVAATVSSQPISAGSSASSLKQAGGATETSGVASEELSAQFAQQDLTAGAPKSGAVAAWNPIEPVSGSAAEGAAGRARALPAASPQVESATEAQSSAETASSTSTASALPSGLLASSLDRSTAVPVSTVFAINGGQRVPPITHDLSKDDSLTRSELPGVASLRLVATNVLVNDLQPVAAASTSLLATNAHSDSAIAASSLSKTAVAAAGNNNLEANSSRTGTVKGSAPARPLTSTGFLATANSLPQRSETQAFSQPSAAVPNAALQLRQAPNGSVEQNSAGAPTGPVAATDPGSQRLAVGISQAAERAKAIGSAGTASQPTSAASTLVSQSNTDRGVSVDGSGNAVGAHAGVTAVTTADHVALPESFNGAAVSGAASSALSVQAVHQGRSNTSDSATVPLQGARNGQSSLSAVTESELGHPVTTLRAAIATEPHQTLVATPTALEVGVHSGSQGWLKIRAEVAGEGEVSASLAAASPSGEQMLKGQLPALNAYLHSEQMSVIASVAERTGIAHGLVLHEAGGTALQAGAGSANSRDSSLLQGGANQGMEGHGNRSQNDAGSAVPLQATSPSDGQTRYETSFERQVASDAALPSSAAESNGQWLNVRV